MKKGQSIGSMGGIDIPDFEQPWDAWYEQMRRSQLASEGIEFDDEIITKDVNQYRDEVLHALAEFWKVPYMQASLWHSQQPLSRHQLTNELHRFPVNSETKQLHLVCAPTLGAMIRRQMAMPPRQCWDIRNGTSCGYTGFNYSSKTAYEETVAAEKAFAEAMEQKDYVAARKHWKQFHISIGCIPSHVEAAADEFFLAYDVVKVPNEPSAAPVDDRGKGSAATTEPEPDSEKRSRLLKFVISTGEKPEVAERIVKALRREIGFSDNPDARKPPEVKPWAEKNLRALLESLKIPTGNQAKANRLLELKTGIVITNKTFGNYLNPL